MRAERRRTDHEKLAYVTTPTRLTVFMRTFLPWQLWRFAVINLKMIEIIARSHRSNPVRRQASDETLRST